MIFNRRERLWLFEANSYPKSLQLFGNALWVFGQNDAFDSKPHYRHCFSKISNNFPIPEHVAKATRPNRKSLPDEYPIIEKALELLPDLKVSE